MRNKCEANHVLYRDGVYYYVRRVPYDLTSHYDVKRLCFSLKTKSASAAVRASKSINQRLEDYWLGLRLQNMDIPASYSGCMTVPSHRSFMRHPIACSKCFCAEAVLLRSLFSTDEISEAMDFDRPVNASICNYLRTSCAPIT